MDSKHPPAACCHHDHASPAAEESPILDKDPVCGMRTDPKKTWYRAEFQGETYFFCSSGCAAQFKAAPDRYARKTPVATDLPEWTIYTCPMHPQIRQLGPGNCPICGMALEPEIATGREGASAELRDMTRRFWIGLALTLPVVMLEMGDHFLGFEALIHDRTSQFLQMILATPVVLWAGLPFFVRGWNSLRARALNMFTLIALGAGIAWIHSMAATLAPGVFPPAFRGHDGTVAVYFDAAAVITVLVLLGQVLELRAREETSGARSRCFSILRPPWPAGSGRMASRKISSLAMFRPATGCGFVPAIRSRSMALCLRGGPMSMNPW